MSRKHFTTEKIIGMLREAEVGLAQGMKVGEICRSVGVSEQAQRRIAEQRATLYTERGQGGYRELAAGVQHDPAPQQPQRPATGTGGYLALRLSTALGDQKQPGIGFNSNLKIGTKTGGKPTGIGALIRWLIQFPGGKQCQNLKNGSKALSILRERFARSEISHEEFESMKKDLIVLIFFADAPSPGFSADPKSLF